MKRLLERIRSFLQSLYGSMGEVEVPHLDEVTLIARVRKLLTDKIADLDRRVDENVDDQFEYELCNRTA